MAAREGAGDGRECGVRVRVVWAAVIAFSDKSKGLY